MTWLKNNPPAIVGTSVMFIFKWEIIRLFRVKIQKLCLAEKKLTRNQNNNNNDNI